jgi:hypothetical protein
MLRITDGRGNIRISALYKIKRNNEQISRVNLNKITATDQITQQSELYVSIRPSHDIKIKRKNRIDLSQEEVKKLTTQQKISDQAAEIETLKARITLLENQLAKSNSENGELRSQLEKITLSNSSRSLQFDSQAEHKSSSQMQSDRKNRKKEKDKVLKKISK